MKLAGKWIVMVNPGIHISTVEAYAGVVPQTPEKDLRVLLANPIFDWKHEVKNDFEATLFSKYHLLREIKESLYEKGAAYAAMSGSGSTIYGIFEQQTDLSGHFSEFKMWQGLLK